MFQNHIMPKKLEEFIDNINKIISEIQEPERKNIIKELEYVEGFFEDVEVKEEEIEERLRSIVENDEKVKKIITEEFKKFIS